MAQCTNPSEVVTCHHVTADNPPDLILVENGKTDVAVCFACADEVEATGFQDTGKLGVSCLHCAGLEGIPLTMPQDGFWHRQQDGTYRLQPDVDVVN